ncbi:hypothetical protein FQN57_003636 [Myotisia sp. PD_48]|nr:hypothetical protein FQN57_003636 [Myotisia sp. PD_48]
MARELDAWQMRLPKERKPGSSEEDDYTLSYHWTWFGRAAHIMPELKRLSHLLLLPTPLRSPEGRQAIEDMVALCRKKTVVSDHPALQPDNGRCPAAECRDPMASLPQKDRWRHIYRCVSKSLRRQYGFSALCFICHQWFTNDKEFEQHCQGHLDQPETIPFQYDVLEVDGMLASPGYNPRRLGDTFLSATDRMTPFLESRALNKELEEFYRANHGSEQLDCGSVHCELIFSSIQELQCHYHDHHCIRPTRKRQRNVKEEVKASQPVSLPAKDDTTAVKFDIITTKDFKQNMGIDPSVTRNPRKRHYSDETAYSSTTELEGTKLNLSILFAGPLQLGRIELAPLHLEQNKDALSIHMCEALEQTLDACDENAQKLREIFEKVIPGEVDT